MQRQTCDWLTDAQLARKKRGRARALCNEIAWFVQPADEALLEQITELCDDAQALAAEPQN